MKFSVARFPSGKWMYVPVNAALTTAVTGSGAVALRGSTSYSLDTGATGSSTARAVTVLYGLSTTVEDQQVDFTKRMRLRVHITRRTSVANIIARLWICDSVPTGAMADRGFGIYIANLTLSGVSYESAEATVSLSTTLTTALGYMIEVVHDPVIPRIEWYVNGVLQGSTTTAANIPTTQSGNISFQAGIINGASAATGGFDFGTIWIWQEFP